MSAVQSNNTGAVYSHQLNFSKVDPRYQDLMISSDRSDTVSGAPQFVSAAEGEVPVIGQVTDVNQWNNRSEVFPGTNISLGKNAEGKETHIVTARVALRHFEELSELKYVEDLQITRPMDVQLAQTTKDVGVTVEKLGKNLFDQGGEGAIVGIVDLGCGFAHKNFLTDGNRTRILSIWHQGGSRAAGTESPYGYGRLYTQDEINQSLKTEDPYKSLGYRPGHSHGTHVMDIAAGSGTQYGLASKANIIFVDIMGSPERKKLADSVCVVEAVKHIFEKAGNRPCVVNLSLGQNAGPHDGTGLVERAFDAMLKDQKNRAIVIAAGNSYADRCHVTGTVLPGSHYDIKWRFPTYDSTPNELEIWYEKANDLEIEIIDTNGRSRGRLGQNSNHVITLEVPGIGIKKIAFAHHRANHPNNGDHCFYMIHSPQYELSGRWTLRLHSKAGQPRAKFHAWIERDDIRPSNFERDRGTGDPDDANYTLGSISTGKLTICVGSYDATKVSKPISYFSSAGKTRDGREKPEVSAPGHDIWAANALTRNELMRASGTSMATPVVTGLIARLFAQAHQGNKYFTIEKLIENFLKPSSRKDKQIAAWDYRYGFGQVSSELLLRYISSNGDVPKPSMINRVITSMKSVVPANLVLRNRNLQSNQQMVQIAILVCLVALIVQNAMMLRSNNQQIIINNNPPSSDDSLFDTIRNIFNGARAFIGL